MLRLLAVLLIVIAFLTSASQGADSLFNLDRHWKIDQIKPGMKGYGLSVFSGTAIERFDVEVVSILKNFNPKGDVILIRCSGQNLEHTGPIAGMSGSPIYLTDDAGNTKMAGAFAYGWPLMKDPLAGVQPIQYMLDMPPAPKPAQGAAVAALPVNTASPRWTMDESYWIGMTTPADKHPLLKALKLTNTSNPIDRPRDLQPLGAPLSCAGLSPAVLDTFAPLLRARGFASLQASGGRDEDGADKIKLEPGSVIAVPLLVGDVDMTAVGTVTEVIGDRVFGFGHPFMSEGPVSLPMANGRVHSVIASIMTSFKLGSMGKVQGTLTNDQMFGVAGTLGDSPAMIPIDIHITYADGSEDRTYHFEAANHPQFTPMLASMALMTAVTGQRELPPNHTVDYDLTINFEKNHHVHLKNSVPDTYSRSFFFQVGMPMMAAATNPFEKIAVTKMTGEIRITPKSDASEIQSVILPKSTYEPGDTLKAFVMHRPFRAVEATLPVEIELPRDLPDGDYMLSIADWQTYLSQEQMSKPFRFVAESADEMFAVLNDVMDVQQKAIYVRLMREADGIAVGRTAMPHLPSSRRQIMLSAGRSDFTPFVSSMVKTIPTEQIMSGGAQFQITIERGQKSKPPHRPAVAPAQPMKPEKATEKPGDQSKPKTDPAVPNEDHPQEGG